MPLTFEMKKGPSAGQRSCGNPILYCCVNTYGNPKQGGCSLCIKCTAISASTGRQCRKSTCLDSKYCWMHLRKIENVMIAPSRVPGGGLGLFCYTNKVVRASDRGSPIFRKYDTITEYGGHTLTKPQIDQFYDYVDDQGHRVDFLTAPYGLELMDHHPQTFRDGACYRRAGAYANGTRNRGDHANAKLKPDATLEATRDIYKGDEIIVTYGPHYWSGIRPDYADVVIKKVAGKHGVSQAGGIGKMRKDQPQQQQQRRRRRRRRRRY